MWSVQNSSSAKLCGWNGWRELTRCVESSSSAPAPKRDFPNWMIFDSWSHCHNLSIIFTLTSESSAPSGNPTVRSKIVTRRASFNKTLNILISVFLNNPQKINPQIELLSSGDSLVEWWSWWKFLLNLYNITTILRLYVGETSCWVDWEVGRRRATHDAIKIAQQIGKHTNVEFNWKTKRLCITWRLASSHISQIHNEFSLSKLPRAWAKPTSSNQPKVWLMPSMSLCDAFRFGWSIKYLPVTFSLAEMSKQTIKSSSSRWFYGFDRSIA